MSRHLSESLRTEFQVNIVPGLHIVANLTSSHNDKLTFSRSFKSFIDIEIENHKLTKLGEVYHDFENGGFTAVVCLSESHLSVHTWPESHYLTFDIFLSNYLRDNRETTYSLFHKVKDFFKAEVVFEKYIDR